MPTNGMTIDSLNTVSSLTAQDEVPVWDKEASGEPTRKITAQNMANSVKSLASLPNTTEMNDAIAQSTAAMPLIEIGQVTVTSGTTKGPLGYSGSADITFSKAHKSIPKVFTNINDVAAYWTSTALAVTINGARITIAGNTENVSKPVFWVAISF